MSKKRVLIITYYWPPSAGVGVQRWMHFALNLVKEGYEPIVFTPSNPQFDLTDQGLCDKVASIETITAPIWEPFNFFHNVTGGRNKQNVKQGLVLEKSKKSLLDSMIIWGRGNLFLPDPRVFWVNSSVKKLQKIIIQRDVDTIITTGPPHSVHLIGLKLKKLHSFVRWFADFRDPWSDWDVLDKLKVGRLARSYHQKMERKVLQNADQVITVSNRLASELALKAVTKKPIEVIANGISDHRTNINHQTSNTSNKFVVGYFGMLNELRDPSSFWDVLESLCKSHPDFHDALEIRIGGIVSQSIRERLEQNDILKSKVRFLGYLTHEEVFKEYANCSLLLLLLNKSSNAKWILPMKFFEYLTVAKPILALGPLDSDLAEIMEGKSIGRILEFDQQSEMRSFLLSIFSNTHQLNQEDYIGLLKAFSRSQQTKELTRLLDKK
ncbi:glycosyltransferase family 4 protein [Marinoscillum furvescens]|uniref:Glycosyltransferase involved in cell wall biosynthesis n=1 Tax=Marinoscillum furvescens DSM 4134 TaxID=1122208 RepID=A0A3D9L0T2_MARFU|nr:glycosyltransferase family 4 protein [Marinoscillum furvescens]RED96633.1 glycosyltransferase involved in cell wall biosynthesis [Marinoscillum furvescens DSM 4134]